MFTILGESVALLVARQTNNQPTIGGLWLIDWLIDWLSSVLRPLQHSIGYMGDGFYRSKDPTNSIKVLKMKVVKEGCGFEAY